MNTDDLPIHLVLQSNEQTGPLCTSDSSPLYVLPTLLHYLQLLWHAWSGGTQRLAGSIPPHYPWTPALQT